MEEGEMVFPNPRYPGYLTRLQSRLSSQHGRGEAFWFSGGHQRHHVRACPGRAEGKRNLSPPWIVKPGFSGPPTVNTSHSRKPLETKNTHSTNVTPKSAEPLTPFCLGREKLSCLWPNLSPLSLAMIFFTTSQGCCLRLQASCFILWRPKGFGCRDSGIQRSQRTQVQMLPLCDLGVTNGF